MAIYAQLDIDVLLTFPITQLERDTTYVNADFIVECTDIDKPVINPAAQKYNMTPLIVGDQVLVRYDVIEKTVEEILTDIATSGGTTINLVPPDLLDAVVEAIKKRIQGMLDAFAITRGYDNIGSAITYRASTNTQFQTEGLRAEYLRDTSWNSLNLYLTDVMSGTVPMPTAWTDISSKLPALTWV